MKPGYLSLSELLAPGPFLWLPYVDLAEAWIFQSFQRAVDRPRRLARIIGHFANQSSS